MIISPSLFDICIKNYDQFNYHITFKEEIEIYVKIYIYILNAFLLTCDSSDERNTQFCFSKKERKIKISFLY